MNNELIKRSELIQYRLKATKEVCDAYGVDASFTQVFDDADTVIIDCRAEIERLTHNNEVMTSLCQDCAADIKRLESRIAELEKPYVPMTISEKVAIRNEWLATGRGTDELISKAEAAVIKRYNEQRGVK